MVVDSSALPMIEVEGGRGLSGLEVKVEVGEAVGSVEEAGLCGESGGAVEAERRLIRSERLRLGVEGKEASGERRRGLDCDRECG